MKILAVFDHPRRNSFCGAVLDAVCEGLHSSGHVAEVADLRAEGFDPRLPVRDEPDWGDSTKVYSPEVLAEQERMSRSEALIFIFPVWWWSMPATMKGWIDRVWNNGWAYGECKLPHRSALLLGTASNSAEDFRKRGYDVAMKTQLVTGVMNYCGVARAELVLLHDVMESQQRRNELLANAYEVGRTYFRT